MIRAKKSLGQNFLTDEIIINRLLKTVSPKKQDSFFEVGSGRGEITRKITPIVRRLDAVEIDKDLIPNLRRLESEFTNLTIHENSVLNMCLGELSEEELKFRVIGNLPYNLSSKIMLWTFSNSEHILDIHYMFQKEFGERLVSIPGKKSYGRLSVITQYLFECEALFKILPESFSPKPSVDSIFIKFLPKPQKNINSTEAKQLQEFTKLVFSKRRKKISTSCKNIINSNQFIDLGINPDSRPESLELSEFLKIIKYLSETSNG